MKMTDKEKIIIDGVDVSECAYFDYENEGTKECYAYSNECEANNCYFKQLARKMQELKSLKNNEDLLISNLQFLWGKQIAEEQGDCKNIDYSKPRTREIYLKISEIEQTLKDVAFAQSVNIGKTKPLGDTGSPKSYRNWERKERKLLERVFLK